MNPEQTYHRNKILPILIESRNQHKTIVDEARAGYKDAVLAALNRHIAEVESGKVRTIVFTLPMPEDHTKDYDKVIRMIELATDPEIELTEAEFSAYVMDDWSWKRAFLGTNAAYSNSAQIANGL